MLWESTHQSTSLGIASVWSRAITASKRQAQSAGARSFLGLGLVFGLIWQRTPSRVPSEWDLVHSERAGVAVRSSSFQNHADRPRYCRSIAPDGGRLTGDAVKTLVAVVCSPPVVCTLVLVVSGLGALLMAQAINTTVGKHVGRAPSTSEPKDDGSVKDSLVATSAPAHPRDPLLDAPMDVDPAPPRSPSPSSAPTRLPFPKVVDGVNEVIHLEL